MKKYLFIFKTTLMESLQYIMNVLLGFVTFFLILFIFLNLWQYIYSDSANLINGYSMNQMIWYVILTEIIWFGARNNTLTREINMDIKSGTIAYVINKPYNYILYMIARHLGETIIKFFLFLSAGIIIGCAFVGPLPDFNVLYLPLIALVVFMGLMIHSLLQMAISILSFWIEDSTPFQWIYNKLILILGILFPIEMFPLWAQPLIKASPVYVVTYGPAKLVIDFSMEMFFKVFAVQCIYFIASSLIIFGLYRKGVKRLNVNGG